MDKINIEEANLKISIEGESTDLYGQDLHTQAVIALIEGADTHLWEKLNIEQGNDEAEPLRIFSVSVLVALARLFAIEDPVGMSWGKSVHEILLENIEYLKDSLGEIIDVESSD